MRRVLPLLALAVAAFACAAVVAVAGAGKPAAVHSAAIGKPKLSSPGDGANVDSVPPFAWKAVRGTAYYEFQLSADSRFRSIVDHGSFSTQNTYASLNKTLVDGTYYWHVRAVDAKKRAGAWSSTRSIDKSWTSAPLLIGPSSDTAINYPRDPLILRWQSVPFATKYRVTIATDPSLAQPVVTSGVGDSVSFSTAGNAVSTSDTKLALPIALAPGRYYWAVTPVDTQGHLGRRSAVANFTWSWPSGTTARVTDLNDSPRVDDYQFSWDAVPGAARYEVEINSSSDWATGSRVCCSYKTTGTSLSPLDNLPNNSYFWRVRPFDSDGNAGQWTQGPNFTKTFDNVLPTVAGMHIRDNTSTSIATGSTTAVPIVTWDPVPGASSYDVWIVRLGALGCNWTQSTSSGDGWLVKTVTTAWTPLGPNPPQKPVQWSGGVSDDASHAFADGQSYCVRVRARADQDTQGHDVVSDWNQIGDVGAPAFTYTADQTTIPSCPTQPVGLEMPAACYGEPGGNGVQVSRMPIFTWQKIDNAGSYFVVVSRDPQFTDIVDEAITRVPAYAPRNGGGIRSYADETTSLYYVVMPAQGTNGSNVTTTPQQDNPQTFNKASIPPSPIGPDNGADVSTQPTFRWGAAEGAKSYRLEVSQDPTFGSTIDDVTTNSTAYTSSSTYPADTVIYWRVRANDGGNIGLTWSRTANFRRRLPAPTLFAPDPVSSQFAPLVTWSAVPGATSYDMHLEQPDGTKKDFSGDRSTAATFVKYYGTGIWTLTMRARFPKDGPGDTAGPWSGPQTFTRYINPPVNARGSLTTGHALLAWDPSPVADKYKVQISTTNSFARTIASATTDNTNYAPDLKNSAYRNGSPLYWRVGVVDSGNNVGAYQVGTLRSPRKLRVKASGSARKGRMSKITIVVRDSRKRPVSRARVTVSGAGVRGVARRTNSKGRTVFKVRAVSKGKITFTAGKDGWDPGQASVRVR